MVNIKTNTEINSDDIVMDADGHADKQKVMRDQRTNAKLYSVAETFQFLAATLLPVGLGVVIATAKLAAGSTAGITLGSVATAFTAPTAMVILGAAAVCTAVAIGSRFMASKHFHNANFNSTEINAQHTAKYIAKELKAQAACVQPEAPQNQRADGKQWTQVVTESSKSLSMAR